jgi:hypothetical protein
MTSKQYHFSLAVGLSLLMLGAVIASQASIGISLIGLGLSIMVLSFLTRPCTSESVRTEISPIALPVQAKQVKQADSIRAMR